MFETRKKSDVEIQIKADFLRNFPLFEDLPHSELVKLASIIDKKESPKYHFIYQAGDLTDSIFFLEKGTVKIGTHSSEGKEVIKAILHPKAMFGELSLLGEEKRSDFAKTMDSATFYYVMKVDDFKEVVRNNSKLSMKLISMLGRKLKNTERRLESLIIKDARARIIDFLKDNARNQGRKVGFEMLLKHSLTQQDIANFTGTSRQTVTSVLNDLKKSNLIYFKRKSILIRDMAALV
ncbi:Crp/Fnr family transcriptional regulator [Portibacter marinus]|uniref:Crp/Fnr family transcriptional regulator n=1 Tax=Portibacter marinus TaxID=2898660 RepID=UPI001F173069|nr:Crp/Fnr family transcriptional regulator [Portibacter marinus]